MPTPADHPVGMETDGQDVSNCGATISLPQLQMLLHSAERRVPSAAALSRPDSADRNMVRNFLSLLDRANHGQACCAVSPGLGIQRPGGVSAGRRCHAAGRVYTWWISTTLALPNILI